MTAEIDKVVAWAREWINPGYPPASTASLARADLALRMPLFDEIARTILSLHGELEERSTVSLCARCALEDEVRPDAADMGIRLHASAEHLRDAIANLEIAMGKRRA